MHVKHCLVAAMVACFVFVSPAVFADQAMTASQWRQKILDTYSKLDRYKVHKVVNITQSGGPAEQHEAITLDISVDRTNKSIAIDADGLRLVGKDNIVRTQMVPDCGTHLHIDDANPLDPATLQKAWPMFPLWLWVPDMSLYMGTEVQLFLKSENFKIADKSTAAGPNQKAFETKLGQVAMTLILDTQTNLIRKAKVVTVGKSAQGDDVTTTLDFDVKYSLPKDWKKDTFAFDVTASKPVGTLKAMIKASQDPSALEGKKAPKIKLDDLQGKPFDLAKVKSRVVVLDFWATWCGPCRHAMPEMIDLNKWGKDNKLDVSVYTVNLQEDKNHVKDFVNEQGWTLPVLLDVDGKTAANYRVFSIPQSVIIVDGKVKRIFTGYAPRFAEEWRKIIREVLGVKE